MRMCRRWPRRPFGPRPKLSAFLSGIAWLLLLAACDLAPWPATIPHLARLPQQPLGEETAEKTPKALPGSFRLAEYHNRSAKDMARMGNPLGRIAGRSYLYISLAAPNTLCDSATGPLSVDVDMGLYETSEAAKQALAALRAQTHQRVDASTGAGEVAYLRYGVVASCSAGQADSRAVGIAFQRYNATGSIELRGAPLVGEDRLRALALQLAQLMDAQLVAGLTAPTPQGPEGRLLNLSPTWSPDGARIAFLSNCDGDLAPYVINADGSGLLRLMTASLDYTRPSWSPNSRQLTFGTSDPRQKATELYIVNADGSGLTTLLAPTRAATCVLWSPDGQRLAFLADQHNNARYELYTIAIDGTQLTRVGDGSVERCPARSPDSRQFAYLAGPTLQVVDISDEQHLTIRGSVMCCEDGYTGDMQLVGNRAYIAYGGASRADMLGGFVIVDVSVPEQPTVLGSYPPFPAFWDPASGVQVEGSVAYVAAGSLVVLDIHNPAAIRELASYEATAGGIELDSGSLYIANTSGGLRIARLLDRRFMLPLAARS